MSAKVHRLGILLVHGIGSQLSREVLVSWGDALVKTINLATRGHTLATVEHADPGLEGVRGAEALVWLHSNNRKTERWLICEGWWADAFPVPTYGELVRWSVSALPWSIALHVAQGYWQRSRQGGTGSTITSIVAATIKLLVALLLTPFSIALLGLSLLLGWLPVAQVRSWILAAQGTLANTIGDSLVFVESPVRAALIRTRLLGAIEQLADRCDRTIVIAHSQGAAVVLDALGGILEPGRPGEARRPSQSTRVPKAVPDTLLTFGAGVNPLAMLKVLASGRLADSGGNPTWLAITALAVGAIVSWVFYSRLTTGSTTFLQILQANGFFLMTTIVLGIIGQFATRITVQTWFGSIAERWPLVRKHKQILVAVAILLAFTFAFGVSYAFFGGSETPLLSVSVLWLALTLLVASCTVLLSDDMKRAVSVVAMPAGLERWIDLYASADPVPNGPILSEQPGNWESSKIWNLGSFLGDHTTYWDNLDGFVLKVVRVCAETARSTWLTHLPPKDPQLDQRSAWRVGCLRFGRVIVAITVATLGLPLWLEYRQRPLPVDLPAWLPATAEVVVRAALLAGLIALLVWFSVGLLRLIWRSWVRYEQQRALAHEPPADGEFYWLWAIVTFVWSVVGLRVLFAANGLGGLGSVFEDPSPFKTAALTVVLSAWVSTWPLIWVKPAPKHTEAAPNGRVSQS